MMHVHDYDMMFEDKGTLNYHLRCKCGDVAHSMDDAVNRTAFSRLRRQTAVLLSVSLVLIGALWILL